MALFHRSVQKVPKDGFIRQGKIVYTVASDPALVPSVSTGRLLWNHHLVRAPLDVEMDYLAFDDVLSE